MAADPVGVVLVDDEAAALSAFERVLSRFSDRVALLGTATSGKAGLALISRTQPQVALLDLHMPGLDGVEVLHELHRRGLAQIRVVMLTAFDARADIRRCLRAGAIGYLLKTSSGAQLVRGIEAAAADEFPLSPEVVRKLVQPHAQPAPKLTGRESDVLALLAEGLSNREIANRLYVEESTVKQYLGTLSAKLGAHNRTQTVVAAMRAGLITPDGD